MIYIIKIFKNDRDGTKYRIYDTESNSQSIIKQYTLKDILKYTNLRIANAAISNNKVILKRWTNEIKTDEIKDYQTSTYGSNFILIGKDNDTYKTVNYEGDAKVFSQNNYNINRLIEMVKSGKIANCIIEETPDGTILNYTDAQIIQRSTKLEEEISRKYEQFIAKATMLGYRDIGFEYTIENNEVILKYYTGSSENVILPNFITVIGKRAFSGSGITSIKLNHGLKIIGDGAFSTSEKLSGIGIQQLDIPETVGIIFEGAFSGNKKLFNSTADNLNTEKFRIHNKNTIVLDQVY